MPSSATITSFYTFAANSKARATQVNTNFSNYRGHIIAIDPSTITASNETYDLGSTEYRWRTGYFRDIDIKANTTTGQALSIIGDTAAGQGAFLIKQGGNVRARIGGGNQYIDLDTTTSQFDFKVAGVTIGSFDTSGLKISGRFIIAATYSANNSGRNLNTSTGTPITNTTVTIQSIGRPILITIAQESPCTLTTGSGNISLQSATTTSGLFGYIAFCKNTTTSILSSWLLRGTFNDTATTLVWPGSSFQAYDFDATSGSTNNYFIFAASSFATTTAGNFLQGGRVMAYSL